MNNDRHPRTMQQAFGPYTDNQLLPMREPRRRTTQDIALVIVGILALVVVLTTGA